MSTTRSLPAVLEAVPEPPTGDPCKCLCGARHPAARGVCAGYIDEPGVRVTFNSLHGDGTGVPICRACADAYPDLP